MPRNAIVPCPAEAWTQLTANDVTELWVADLSGHGGYLQATATGTAPTGTPSDNAPVWLGPMDILAADLTLAQLFPGVSGAARLWAWPQVDSRLSVSHA